MVDAYGREVKVGDKVAYVYKTNIKVGNISKIYDNNYECSVDNHAHIYDSRIYLLNE